MDCSRSSSCGRSPAPKSAAIPTPAQVFCNLALHTGLQPGSCTAPCRRCRRFRSRSRRDLLVSAWLLYWSPDQNRAETTPHSWLRSSLWPRPPPVRLKAAYRSPPPRRLGRPGREDSPDFAGLASLIVPDPSAPRPPDVFWSPASHPSNSACHGSRSARSVARAISGKNSG